MPWPKMASKLEKISFGLCPLARTKTGQVWRKEKFLELYDRESGSIPVLFILPLDSLYYPEQTLQPCCVSLR